jgi:hypothetical protein
MCRMRDAPELQRVPGVAAVGPPIAEFDRDHDVAISRWRWVRIEAYARERLRH